jgi:hypothetical protein
MYLRQSTAQVIRFGPCLDKDDGVTEETALTLAQADMRLSKDGGAFAQKSAAGNATHDSDGWYSTTLSTTDTATVGELILNVHQPANMLPVWKTFYVVEEAVYDQLFAASAAGALQPTVAGRTLDVTAAGEAGIDLDNTSGTLDAAQIGADAITAAKVAADVHAETADAVWDEPKADHTTATTFGDIPTDLDAVLADTADMQPKLGTPGITVSDDIANVQSVVDALPSAVAIANAVLPQKNVAFSDIYVNMVLSSDHVTASTGLTLGVTRSIDGGAFGAGTGTAAEISSGVYQYDASAADMNGSLIIFRFTGASSDDTFVVVRTAG